MPSRPTAHRGDLHLRDKLNPLSDRPQDRVRLDDAQELQLVVVRGALLPKLGHNVVALAQALLEAMIRIVASPMIAEFSSRAPGQRCSGPVKLISRVGPWVAYERSQTPKRRTKTTMRQVPGRLMMKRMRKKGRMLRLDPRHYGLVSRAGLVRLPHHHQTIGDTGHNISDADVRPCLVRHARRRSEHAVCRPRRRQLSRGGIQRTQQRRPLAVLMRGNGGRNWQKRMIEEGRPT